LTLTTAAAISSSAEAAFSDSRAWTSEPLATLSVRERNSPAEFATRDAMQLICAIRVCSFSIIALKAVDASRRLRRHRPFRE